MAGQRKLKGSAVLCIGTGGLGSPLLMYLAAAGVGRIGIVDFDVVDESNLQRQVLHGTASVGRPKVQSAAERIKDINPHVQVDIYEEALTSENALKIVEPYDVVVDGTDNFPTRYLVNDACVILGKPNVYGSIFKFEGQASVFNYKGGPNYRDLYPEPPLPGWFRAAQRVEYWASCRASLDASRPPRPSRSYWGRATPSRAGSSSTMPSA